MDSGEGGGDGGGGEERDADLSPQALSLPLLTLAAIPEQGSSSHTSAVALAKEPLTLSQREEQEEGAEGSQAREETQEGEGKEAGGHFQGDVGCQNQEMKEDNGQGNLFGREKEEEEVYTSTREDSLTATLSGRDGEEEEEEEEAISNQSQTKSKCSLLPQQSQHSSSSSTAMASGTSNSKTTASPKPSPTPPASPTPSPFLSTSPKHFTCPPSSSTPLSETEVKDMKGDWGWISGFPQSFKSQQSAPAFPLAGAQFACTPAEDDGPAGVPHTSIANGDGAKAPGPNNSQLENEERDKDGELKEAVLLNLNQDLSPNSLTSHMTIMHSRNSCKTLKCPKCNWHYKSQHTLQVHMREKHPETGGQCVCGGSGGKCVCGGATRGVCRYCSSGKPHPRLARGETYACGYKPYRCEVCDYATSSKGNLSIHMQSDKHLNNVQNGGHSNGQMHTSHTAHVHNGSSSNGHAVDKQAYKLALPVHTPAAQPAKPAPSTHSHSLGKRWRCDVCDYETSIARNLRIHTTSEKHTHNMLKLQRGYYLSHCGSLSPQFKHLQNAGGELSLNMHLTSQQVTEQPVNLGATLTPSPSPSPSPPPAPSLSPTGPLSTGVFQCLVCSCFSSDSLESVEQHLNNPRSLPQSEWCSLVAGGCHCRLCGYTTPLRANFSLHCQTDRHRTRYQLAAHLQEGGDRGQEVVALIAKGNPVQLRCNLCDYVSSSLEKLRGHSLSSHHEASVRVYRFLQQYDGEVDGGLWMFHCLLCNHSSSSKFQLLKHSQTPTHQQREGLLQLQPMGGEELAAIFTIRKSPVNVTGGSSEDIETSSETTAGPLDQTKDTCNLGVKQISKETEETCGKEREKRGLLTSSKRASSRCEEMENPLSPKRPRIHQQNENQQAVQCPLCQVKLPYTHLRQHLTHLHSVAQDCVDKLISTVSPSIEQPKPNMETEKTEIGSNTDISPCDSCMDKTNTDATNNTDSLVTDDSQKNQGMSVKNNEANEAAPKDVTALLTPPLEDTSAHPSNGRLAPESPTHSPPPSPPGSSPSEAPPLSDRHGYRFRCSRCSLAFPTQEKLQLHWQYHAMRAATECPLCSRRCRSQEALHRHMQNTHAQLDSTDVQSTLLPPQTAQLHLEHSLSSVQQDLSLSPQVGQEAGEGEEEEMAEEALGIEGKEEQREEEKIKEKCKVGNGGEEALMEVERGQQEESGSGPNPSLPFKKSSNSTMDRYLDPSRPYKCTICSESFTQKTILLVHYNSVSHLHRARRALQDSGPGLASPEAPRGPDSRPYRCRLCGVGYSQSSTLDIHLRSVLHQTRARAAQNMTAQTPASSIAAPAAITPAQAGTNREENSRSLPLAKKPDQVTLTTSSLASSREAPVAETQLTIPGQSESQQAKKRVADLLVSRNQLMLMQQQQLVQAQVQLQQHTALLQSPLFNPALLQHHPLGHEGILKQHFPLVPDNLLSLQQQLLLPFYLSGEMKLNPDLTLKSPEQTDSVNSISTDHLQGEAMKEPPPQIEEDQMEEEQTQSSDLTVTQPNVHVQCEAKVEADYISPSVKQTERAYCTTLQEEKTETVVPAVKTEKQVKEIIHVDGSSLNDRGSEFPPPRVPYTAVNGEPLRALLQSYGYELALQYTQNRQRHQLKIATQMAPEGQGSSGLGKGEVCSEEERDDFREQQDEKVAGWKEKNRRGERANKEIDRFLEEKKQSEQKDLLFGRIGCCEGGEKCKDCGKLFSDALVLKSHQEYIHRLLFPTVVLERFSREYRLQYDRLYPMTKPTTEETSGATTPGVASAPAPEPEPAPESEPVKSPAKTLQITPVPSALDPAPKTSATTTDLTPAAPVLSPSSSPHLQVSPLKEVPTTSTGAPAISQITSQAKPVSLPLPVLSLPLPQLPLPPLSLPKLPLPPIPFPMEMSLLPPVMMQSVALQSQPWLDTGMTPDLAKLYQSQLSPALLSRQPQLSPALLGQPPQLNPGLLAQSSHPSPILLGQPPQGSQTLQEQQQSKRGRTRITDEQLSVLRQHFDINSLPSDEEVSKITSLSGLPHKVIKHWFRNTLFKERQRDKDSPYNFNNPPTTALDESKEEMAQMQILTDTPSSISPALPVSHSPQLQRADPLRGETHRGRRSSRTRFTEQQLETLQGVFEATPYPREEEYDRLSALLSLPNRVIVVWFQNARQRARKNQDRGTEDGGEGKTQGDGVQRRCGDLTKNDDKDDDDFVDDGQSDRQNENSMDLTYEYYSHPDSPPALDLPPDSTGTEHMLAKGDPSPVHQIQEYSSPQVERSKVSVQTHISIPEASSQTQSRETVEALQTISSLPSLPQPRSEISPERLQPSSTPLSQKSAATTLSTSQFSLQQIHNHLSAPVVEKPVHTPRSLSPAPENETSNHPLPDATPCPSPEIQPQSSLQTQAQFQCSLCPMSLPSFQLWQEHQTRHLLAAQSQVQLLHSGFTDRPMPYMMLHPNPTLMASQLLSGAMSQMHPKPTHPMIPHINSMHLKNSFSDLSSNSLTGQPQTSLSTIKQSSKVMSEVSYDAPAGGREVEEEQRRDKRQRTTITPEQLEVLYQRYSLDSNPTRGVLESIARDVGLKRRVVQVWFQNTRARERKGQFRSMGPGTSFGLGLNHLRCPFCRALFKVKSALDAHMRSRHWAEAEKAGYGLSMSNGSNSQMANMVMTSLMEKAGPSATSNFNPNPIDNKELPVKPPITSNPSAIDLNNPEEECEYEEEEEEEEYPCEEGSSIAEQESLSPEDPGGPSSEWGETQTPRQHQQRQRTQMSHFQVLQLRDFYRNHRTPNRQECEALGQELGLPHRVVQVWFQNARAKEKRARSISSDSAEREQAELTAGAGERDRA